MEPQDQGVFRCTATNHEVKSNDVAISIYVHGKLIRLVIGAERFYTSCVEINVLIPRMQGYFWNKLR